MSGSVLDGKRISREIQEELRPRIAALTAKHRPPALAVVRVGDNPASEIYVRNKIKACHDLGIRSVEIAPPGDLATAQLIELIQPLVNDSSIDAILIQMPLPRQIDAALVTSSIVDPARDVDGFGAFSLGRLVMNEAAPRACTPAGILELLKRYRIPIAGQHAVVVGRSNIVGKPMALMLLHENATVTICHSRTRDLPAVCAQADVLVAAVGSPGLVTADFVKPGAAVVDVGITRRPEGLVGDVDFDAVVERAGAITPVPGGVGPMTIACLLRNTLAAARIQHPSDRVLVEPPPND
jgi:methylenetetrahydrofolate dehydrogenase (NADP+)/methenyltetrahydrofolate cyclohydrolase